MLTKYIKIAQLLLLYYVVVQSYVIPENRSLTEVANSSRDLCNDMIDQGDKSDYNFEAYLSYLSLSYNWSSTLFYYPNTRGRRSFNKHPLENQSSVTVEKSDDEVKGQKITANEVIEHTMWIITEVKKSHKIVEDAAIKSSRKDFSKDADAGILWFVIMVYHWTSDVMILNTIGKSYYEKIFELPERCISRLEINYTLQDHIERSTDIISIIKTIQNELRAKSNESSGEKGNDTMKRNSRTAELLEELIKSIVTKLRAKLNSEKTHHISSHINNDLFNLQLLAYKWALNIRLYNYLNIHKKSVRKNFQPPLEGQSSFPMEKNDNEPTDQEEHTVDILNREGRSLTTEDTDASNNIVCKFKRTISQSLEIKLFTFHFIVFKWSYNEYGLSIVRRTRSINDFQLPLDDQSFSLPMEESGLEDEEITIKDFMDNIKLTIRQLNENLNISEEATMDTDNDSSQKLWNVEDHTHVQRSNPDPIDIRFENFNFLRLKFKLTIYRWISNIIIYNTIDLTSLSDSDVYPRLRECQLTSFPTKDHLREFEEMSAEIISLINKLLQISAVEI